MTDRLFPIEDVPEVPVLPPPRRRKSEGDARFRNDYPPEWDRCPGCDGVGEIAYMVEGGSTMFVRDAETSDRDFTTIPCEDCEGMGSLKARVRLEAGHRCLRCRHPYVPKGDAFMLGVEPSWREGGWSACDGQCEHALDWSVRHWPAEEPFFEEEVGYAEVEYEEEDGEVEVIEHAGELARDEFWHVEAAWRVLTVHHADGDKANCRWWNLLALCQRCHLEIQAKVVMERVWPFEHSEWFKPFVAGYYAFVYLGEDLTRAQVAERQDELLALERVA